MMVYEIIRELGDRHLYRVRGRLPSMYLEAIVQGGSHGSGLMRVVIKVPGLNLVHGPSGKPLPKLIL